MKLRMLNQPELGTDDYRQWWDSLNRFERFFLRRWFKVRHTWKMWTSATYRELVRLIDLEFAKRVAEAYDNEIMYGTGYNKDA